MKLSELWHKATPQEKHGPIKAMTNEAMYAIIENAEEYSIEEIVAVCAEFLRRMVKLVPAPAPEAAPVAVEQPAVEKIEVDPAEIEAAERSSE